MRPSKGCSKRYTCPYGPNKVEVADDEADDAFFTVEESAPVEPEEADEADSALLLLPSSCLASQMLRASRKSICRRTSELCTKRARSCSP